MKGKNPQWVWVLDADLKAAFDRIDHDHLLAQLGAFLARGLVASWLKAGVFGRGQFAPTEEGTPARGDWPAEESGRLCDLFGRAPAGGVGVA